VKASECPTLLPGSGCRWICHLIATLVGDGHRRLECLLDEPVGASAGFAVQELLAPEGTGDLAGLTVSGSFPRKSRRSQHFEPGDRFSIVPVTWFPFVGCPRDRSKTGWCDGEPACSARSKRPRCRSLRKWTEFWSW
jgi:hypothetical protein